MNGRKISNVVSATDQDFTIHPQAFVFFDKKTGTRRFEVKANADGGLPADHAASLLAVHCVMRGQAPKDVGILVAAGEDLVNGLEKHAEKLIQHYKMRQSPVQLTKRELEVLHEVLRISSTKDIAQKAHISVRTVKFHISALLAKFGVASRMELVRKTFNLFYEERTFRTPGIPQLVADPEPRNIRESVEAANGRAHASGLERRSCR